MTSLRFWLALMTPFVSHPLYMRRGVWQPPPFMGKRGIIGKLLQLYMNNEKNALFVLFGIVVLATLVIGYDKVLLAIIVGVLGVLVLGVPLILMFSGTVYGMISAIVISGAIMNERLQGRYLILGVTPSGFLGASWALCSLCIQNSALLRQLRNVMRTVYSTVTALIMLPFILSSMLYLISGNAQTANVWGVLLIAMGIFMMIVIDFFQSACVGSLLGIIAPHHSQTRANTQNSVISNFLVLQVTVYLLTAFTCLIIIPSLLQAISYPITPFYVFICLGVLYGYRELLILALWHGLAITLDDDVIQLNRLTRIRIKERSWIGHSARRLLRLLWRNPLD